MQYFNNTSRCFDELLAPWRYEVQQIRKYGHVIKGFARYPLEPAKKAQRQLHAAMVARLLFKSSSSSLLYMKLVSYPELS